MKRVFRVFCGLLMASWLLASCLSSNDSDTTVYDDTAVTAFTLGTLNRYLHTTTKAGNDSVYKATYTGSLYAMSIDQLNHRIYNTDSLPYGTDAAHVICNITTRNNGVVAVKSLVSDTLFFMQSGVDSIDLSTPRTFRVFATDGSGSRDYVVTLNVRKQAAGKMQWTLMPQGTPLPQTSAPWEFNVAPDRLGIVSSRDHWATSTEEPFNGDDISLLPMGNCSSTCWNLDKGIVYALLIGDNDLVDRSVVVWRRLIDSDYLSGWNYLPLADDNSYCLPKGRHYWLLPYTEGSVLAVDDAGTIYQSRDQGITWKTTPQLVSPVGTVAAAAVDADGGIWLSEGGENGAVWYGKMTD